MNSIPASVFLLCIVKLQEFSYKYGYKDYSQLAELLLYLCNSDGSEVKSFPLNLLYIRDSEPFKYLDLSQESFVYETFKNLKSGI